MSNSTILLPTSPVLSSDSAIEAILTDIPLFCEGIMGIGVFTFLFLTKQVRLLAIFLYASSFLAFTAATLDLGQVLARAPKQSATNISLASVLDLLYAREVFLSASFFFLDLFFWTLVAHCPQKERPTKLDSLRMKPRLSSSHSASWNRWGLMGTMLKWATLAASISVPLLQLSWRLIPSQRKYSSIYVAESTIQTSVTAIFILKLLLNIYISPLDHWWRALQPYAAPIGALVIGTVLGVGNLTSFAFTETALGRFLRAVEVYILIVHSLYTTFQDLSATMPIPDSENDFSAPKMLPEKSEYSGALPYPITSANYTGPNPLPFPQTKADPMTETTSRLSILSLVLPSPPPKRISALLLPPFVDYARNLPSSPAPIGKSSRQTERRTDDTFKIDDMATRRRASLQRGSITSERPITTISLSYYGSNLNFPQITQDLEPLDSTRPPFTGSNQGSITSIDELLRQQTELDKSIAALRLVSMAMSTVPQYTDKQSTGEETSMIQPGRERSTVMSAKTESLSNRSDFSLSVFPDPPIVPKDEVATKYPVELGDRIEVQASSFSAQESASEDEQAPPARLAVDNPLSPSSSRYLVQPPPNSPHAQYDVTSFIGDLSEPSRTSQAMGSSDGFVSESEGTVEIATALLSPSSGLRPMFLPSMVSTSPPETGLLSSEAVTTYGGEKNPVSISPGEATKSLRPLLLSKPRSSRGVPQQFSVTMIPLAQRRQRGGTISSNTRRPVIGIPRMDEDGVRGDSGAFERPRAPPLRTIDQISPV